MKTFKKMNKIIAILASILLIVAVFAPLTSLAADDEETTSYTITVTGDDLAGRTIAVYQIFNITVNYDDEGNVESYTYTWASTGENSVEEFFTTYNLGTEDEPEYLTTALEWAEYLKTLSTTELTELAEEFYDYCVENSIAAVTEKTAGSDATSLELTVYAQGYYLLYDTTTTLSTGSARSAAMLTVVTADTEVELKADKVEVEKEVDKTSAEVGETVNFTITSAVPNLTGYESYTFTVTDTLSKGLTLTTGTATDEETGETYTTYDVKVVIEVTTTDEETGETSTQTIEYSSDYYTVTSTVDEETGETTLVITFDDEEFVKQLSEYTGATIKITYSATVNSDALEYNYVTNTVKVKYSNDPDTDGTGETEEDKVYVYTYTVNFTKSNVSGDTLEGAEFYLTKTVTDDEGNTTTYYYKLNNDGTISWVTSEDDATKIKSDENGLFTIAGLSAGTYTLIEVTAPEGYSLPSFDGFTFTINQTLNDDGTLKSATFDYTSDVDSDGDTVDAAVGYIKDVTSTSATFAVTVLNATEGYLPSTGGIGTKIFTAVGIIVMISAGVALVVRNKRNS